ncbi:MULTISPECIES: DUF1345 domain-containing protein [Sphingosinicellaceae]|uniref:DUF1345 domain-containing protein n=1 Tax=Sphingosinicellaceae TaxID=2820280 RepID=UPI001C1E64FD|nr:MULTISPECIES: DUF1345 domain-containing protein [Polymorphobacter]QYE34143.1 DUF1345 domain-containing protein [Polymorphobacter sp. PAMC 29334]UAJ09322.1 DUF1345 domain-containing protein [Polymorphobacter megasporae]
MSRIRYFNFWLFVVAMIVVALATGPVVGPARSVLIGFDAGALLWIILTLRMMWGSKTDTMRARAKENDPDSHILLAIALLIVAVVLVAVTVELVGVSGGHGSALGVAGGTLLIVWLFSNLLFALHYAHGFYAPGDIDDEPGRGDGEKQDSGGLEFPGDAMPNYSDFAYFSFVLGMTFQVSDVQITSQSMRRLALGHALAAFLFNIIVVALSVSLIGNMLQK